MKRSYGVPGVVAWYLPRRSCEVKNGACVVFVACGVIMSGVIADCTRE